MSTQKNLKNWELKNNSLKERIEFLMTPEELEKPYSFAKRVGLPKGTFTGIWINGRQSLHKSTLERICFATGANPAWLSTGIGEPFPERNEIAQSSKETERTYKNDVPLSIDSHLLIQSIETAEKALKVANGTMTPEDKAEFITTLFFNANLNNVSEDLLKACISLIEKALKETRRNLSPKPKSELIIIIYNFYYDKPWTEEHLKSALDQLIRSVS